MPEYYFLPIFNNWNTVLRQQWPATTGHIFRYNAKIFLKSSLKNTENIKVEAGLHFKELKGNGLWGFQYIDLLKIDAFQTLKVTSEKNNTK